MALRKNEPADLWKLASYAESVVTFWQPSMFVIWNWPSTSRGSGLWPYYRRSYLGYQRGNIIACVMAGCPWPISLWLAYCLGWHLSITRPAEAASSWPAVLLLCVDDIWYHWLTLCWKHSLCDPLLMCDIVLLICVILLSIGIVITLTLSIYQYYPYWYWCALSSIIVIVQYIDCWPRPCCVLSVSFIIQYPSLYWRWYVVTLVACWYRWRWPVVTVIHLTDIWYLLMWRYCERDCICCGLTLLWPWWPIYRIVCCCWSWRRIWYHLVVIIVPFVWYLCWRYWLLIQYLVTKLAVVDSFLVFGIWCDGNRYCYWLLSVWPAIGIVRGDIRYLWPCQPKSVILSIHLVTLILTFSDWLKLCIVKNYSIGSWCDLTVFGEVIFVREIDTASEVTWSGIVERSNRLEIGMTWNDGPVFGCLIWLAYVVMTIRSHVWK